jgi:PAS domain S-box-containing protein
MRLDDPTMLEPFAWSPVLIVDDDEASALLALKLLLRAGLRSVDTLTDARQVVDWVTEHRPDVVLLDLHMPYLDGYAVLAALRERASSTELPVIVLSADDTLDASRRALALGANDFLLKPLQPTELVHRTRNLLDMRAAHRILHRRQRWLEEAERFSRELFSGEVGGSLLTLADRAMPLADADRVITLASAREADLDGASGNDGWCLAEAHTDSSTGLAVHLGIQLCTQLAERGTPVLIEDAKNHPEVTIDGTDPIDVGPMMLLPVRVAEVTHAVVGLLRERGREPYSTSDLEMAYEFVSRAAIALELVDRRADRKQYLDFFEILVSQVAEYAIVRLDLDGMVASWNAGAERVEGYTAEDAAGKHFSIFHPPEDIEAGEPQRLLDEARANGRAHHQGWGVRKDGTRFWAERSITALHDERDALIGYALVTRDMTESRSLEMARESFFASLSHDLRTPLSSIQGFVEMIPLVDEPRRGEFINRVQSNVDRLTVLIDDLLDHARLRSGAVPLSPEVLYAPGVAAASVRDLAPLLGSHEVVVGRSDLTIVADQQALGRVLANLLVNAARYSPEGTPIEVSFETAEDVGRIIVTDHGRGIAQEDLEKIFDEFERGSLAQPDGGTGLGLSSVRQLVALQHGNVAIASQPGIGTRVTVELPLPAAPSPVTT